jgi:hypothetical protein
MAEVEIQGIICRYRDLRQSLITEDGELIEGEEILYANLPQEEQYFRRIDHPFTNEDELVEIANAPYDERKGKYNKIQLEWVEREEKRMTYGEGVYAMINGVLTYIPASYWGYINHWILEHGDKPEYREADRIFFLFMEYICFETDVMGITRGKGRRQGATSLGFYWMWWICGRLPEKKGGSISFNDTAADKNFQQMFMRGFKGMLPCFVRDFDSSAEKFVRFVKPIEKAKKGVIQKRAGLNSYCDYLSNSINAYDSGRLSFGLFDESGKYEKMNINTYWSKVFPTLRWGRKKVGFAYMPTTVNPQKKGGENFEKFWKDANQNAINPNTGEPFGLNTPHKVIRYFVPATEGYAGCIDKFGASVVDDPKEPILGNDGLWITEGARTVILKERALKTGDQLLEHRRDFPLDEWDMFAFSTGNCEFDEENFKNQIKFLEENPDVAFWRQGRLYEEYDTEQKKIIVKWADDPKGECFIKEFPEQENLYANRGGTLEPMNEIMYSIGADTYKNIFADGGSDGAISVVKKSCIIDGKETGLMPVFFFVGRPKLIKQFNRQMLLVCLFFGGKVNVERDAGTWFYEDFLEWDALSFLEWTPALDLTKPKQKILPGTESGNPFELAKQLEVAKLYYDGNSKIVYNGNVHRVTYLPLLREGLQYNHAERTPYHLTVSFMMALLPILGRPRPRGGDKAPAKPKQLLPQYKIRLN